MSKAIEDHPVHALTAIGATAILGLSAAGAALPEADPIFAAIELHRETRSALRAAEAKHHEFETDDDVGKRSVMLGEIAIVDRFEPDYGSRRDARFYVRANRWLLADASFCRGQRKGLCRARAET